MVTRPYHALGERLGLAEADVIDGVRRLLDAGVVKRLGLVVRHRRLGYRSNAMVVWDIPNADVDAVGGRMGACDGVTLCYRRPRRPPRWPYNLFCMIHGKDRERVLAQVDAVARVCDIADRPRRVLFSRRCFRQRGARYGDGGGRRAA